MAQDDLLFDSDQQHLQTEYDDFATFAEKDTILRIGIVMSDIYSKKDMEFAKGLLLGIKESSLPDNSLSLKIINGEIPTDSLAYELDNFEPQVLISTFEKETPSILNTYSLQHGIEIINVFDAKNADYLYNPYAYQLLAPSEVFNSSITDYFAGNFSDNILVLIGDPDYTDLMIRDLIVSWPDENVLVINSEDIGVFSLETDLNYIICPITTNYKEIKDIISEIIRLIAETPDAGVRLLGRPNWVTFNDLNSLISNIATFIPSRCYFDISDEESKRFISSYNSSYGHAPIRSYPVYSVMGYDTSKYFLPEFASSLKGNPVAWKEENMIQSYFDMQKSENGGFYNKGSLLLHYEPWGSLKIENLN